MTLAELEKVGIETALASTDFNLNAAARILGIDRKTLFRKVEAYGLRKAKPPGMSASAEPMRLAEIERAAIETELSSAGFNIREAARRLGIDRRTLYRKVEFYGFRENVIRGRETKAKLITGRGPLAQAKRKAKQRERGACVSCGGVVQPVQKPGRVYSYRGRIDVKIPEDFPVDTCASCGAIYMDREAHEELERRIEQRVHESRVKKPGTAKP